MEKNFDVNWENISFNLDNLNNLMSIYANKNIEPSTFANYSSTINGLIKETE